MWIQKVIFLPVRLGPVPVLYFREGHVPPREGPLDNFGENTQNLPQCHFDGRRSTQTLVTGTVHGMSSNSSPLVVNLVVSDSTSRIDTDSHLLQVSV